MFGWCHLELKSVFSLILECPYKGNNEKLQCEVVYMSIIIAEMQQYMHLKNYHSAFTK